MDSKVKCCAVPQCDNTTLKTPNMVFVNVPHKKRNNWLNLAQCDPKSILSSKSPIYFCEDHFDLPNDMENYMEYHAMGAVTNIRMKPDCVPSKFNCQVDRKEAISDTAQPCLKPEIKSEPMDEQYEIPEEDSHEELVDIKIEVEEHPVASKLGEEVTAFTPCTRQILPKINMFSIIEYIVQNDSYKYIDYKNLKNDIDINAEDTIGYVQQHKMDNLITLQATVAFDRDTAHRCLVKYDEYTLSISYTNCECQLVACHHVIAFLMWLHRRSEEQLDNDMSYCLEPLVQQTTILKAKDIVCDSDTDSLSEDLDLPDNLEDIQQNILQDFVKSCKKLKVYSSPVYRYVNNNDYLELSLHRLQASWRDSGAEADAEHFLQYCTERMAARELSLQELVSCEDKELCCELRYGRLEGRQVFDISSYMESESEHHHTSPLDDNELSDKILNPEIQADDEFKEKMKSTIEKQLGIKINKCGIILSKEYPILYAIPYGLTDTHVIDMIYIENEDEISNYMEDNILKLNTQYVLQYNMLLAKREKAYFIIIYKKDGMAKRILILDVMVNKNCCKTYINRGILYWKEHIFNVISPT